MLRSLSFLGAASVVLASCGQPPPASSSTADAAVTPPSGPMTLAEAAALKPVGDPIEAVLTSAPAVPPPTNRHEAKTVVVHLAVKEVVKPIAPGVDYTFWTFGGDVPGKFIRIRQGDTVEFHLQNDPNNKMPHNIDLHAVSGPGGGAAASATAPGHESVFTFKALNAGLFVYHCATAPVPMHVANGMYGLILVEPPEGLPPVDKEYYVMEGDFYTAGGYHEAGLQPFDIQKAIDETPTYVLFNGAEGSLTGDKAITAAKGEKVRIFFGDGGPNMTSSFHVIGEIFDKVYTEAGTHPQENVQTTMVPAGGAAIAEFTADVPGTYILVDHSLTRVFNKGALAMLKVSGDEDKTLYSGKIADVPYAGDGSTELASAAPADPRDHGKQVFESTCAMCHQQDGQGVPGVFPPLAGSDFLLGPDEKVVHIPLSGLTGTVTVNGKDYNGTMPSFAQLADQDIADALTYARTSWGNHGKPVSVDQVAAARTQLAAAK